MAVLERYKDKFRCFNDDIQGTGAVAVAGVLSALNAIGEDASSALKTKRIMIAGAGSAGIGVATALASAMAQQGISLEDARKMFYVCDVDGVLSAERAAELTPEQAAFARSDGAAGMDLQTCIDTVKVSFFQTSRYVPLTSSCESCSQLTCPAKCHIYLFIYLFIYI